MCNAGSIEVVNGNHLTKGHNVISLQDQDGLIRLHEAKLHHPMDESDNMHFQDSK